MTGLTRARQGDSVDAIAWREYGDTAMTEPILEANRGLAGLGAILPQDTPVALPPRRAPPPRAAASLWD